ncbi:hypothetical protein N431DRAFT_482315 [Stipitochalara longipes BDJ]|nr:hypothetical protein N431DRAFT_482315 [Stipitochalara longipes BDJ]
MDFVPSPSNVSVPLEEQLPPIEVPYVATFTYDFEGFEGFPDRLGFVKDGQLDLETRSIDEFASLLQSWLYFGVICEFIERPIEVSKFVYPSLQEEGREVLRWSPCGYEAIFDWGTRMNLLDGRSSRAVSDRINSVLHRAAFFALEVEKLGFSQTPPLPVISLSVKTLLHVLFSALQWRNRFPALTPPYHPVLPYGANEMPASTKLLLSRMTDQGWCPSQAHSLFQKSDHYTLLFLSQLSRRGGTGKRHDSCSARECVANNVDMSHYETKHRTPSCMCNFVEIPKLPLIEIIKSGGIPLVSVHPGPHNTVEIRIEKANPSTRYTAISHVWSDGLGNPNSNALPQCQLEWLSTCLERLPSHGYQGIYYNNYGGIAVDAGGLDAISRSKMNKEAPRFWMDTLCIPVDDEYAELRTEAINKMAAYYAQATGALILDSELQRLRIAVHEAEEVLARIANCAWAGRCWTMQEGAISPICYFQCADGALQLDGTDHSKQVSRLLDTSASGNTMGLIGQSIGEIGRRMGQEVQGWVAKKRNAHVDASELNKLFLRIILDDFQVRQRKFERRDIDSAMRFNETVQNYRFVTIWNQLSQRTTTKFEDIYIIVANLLDFNAGQIMKLPTNERMKTILWSGRYVPLSLLYSNGPRLNPGKNYRERWVPSTPRGNILNTVPKLEFVADGLRLLSSAVEGYSSVAGEHITMVLSKCLYINCYCFMVDSGRQKTYFVKAIRADSDEFQIDSGVATCCIFEKADGSLHNGYGPELKGASLLITDIKREVFNSLEDSQIPEGGSSESSVRLVAIYDCPIRVWEIERAGMIPVSEIKEYELLHKTEPAPIIQVESLKSQWEVILQTETPRLEKPYPRRPFPAAPVLLMSAKVFTFLAIIFLGLPLNLLLTVKWVRRLEPLSKPSMAAIFLFYLVDVAPPLVLIASITNLLNLAVGSHHQVGQIFIWAVLQFCVLYFPAVILWAVWHFSLREYAYAAWLSTFDENWTEKDRYALWWKLMSFEVWLSSFGRSADGVQRKVDSKLTNFENSIKLRMSNLVSTWKQEREELELAEQEKKKKTMDDVEFDKAVVSKLLQPSISEDGSS